MGEILKLLLLIWDIAGLVALCWLFWWAAHLPDPAGPDVKWGDS